MSPAGGRDVRLFDRRRWRRTTLAAPVQFGKGAEGKGEVLSPPTGWSKELSAGGVYVTTQEGRGLVPGELTRLSISIPWESRRTFPFALIEGSGRVVRVDELATGQGKREGIAIEFCEGITMLGAIVTP